MQEGFPTKKPLDPLEAIRKKLMPKFASFPACRNPPDTCKMPA